MESLDTHVDAAVALEQHSSTRLLSEEIVSIIGEIVEKNESLDTHDNTAVTLEQHSCIRLPPAEIISIIGEFLQHMHAFRSLRQLATAHPYVLDSLRRTLKRFIVFQETLTDDLSLENDWTRFYDSLKTSHMHWIILSFVMKTSRMLTADHLVEARSSINGLRGLVYWSGDFEDAYGGRRTVKGTTRSGGSLCIDIFEENFQATDLDMHHLNQAISVAHYTSPTRSRSGAWCLDDERVFLYPKITRSPTELDSSPKRCSLISPVDFALGQKDYIVDFEGQNLDDSWKWIGELLQQLLLGLSNGVKVDAESPDCCHINARCRLTVQGFSKHESLHQLMLILQEVYKRFPKTSVVVVTLTIDVLKAEDILALEAVIDLFDCIASDFASAAKQLGIDRIYHALAPRQILEFIPSDKNSAWVTAILQYQQRPRLLERGTGDSARVTPPTESLVGSAVLALNGERIKSEKEFVWKSKKETTLNSV